MPAARMRTNVILLIVLATAFPAQTHDASSLKSLYAHRQWTDLYRAVQSDKHETLYRGIVAAVFGDDRKALSLLRSVIRTAPKSPEAYEAYEWITHIYFRTGQYRKLMTNMEARWTAFPDKPELKTEQTMLAAFRGLPDQQTERPRASQLPHDSHDLFIPVTVNGVSATYFFDTGAWLNCMSESEAKRLGLAVPDAASTLATATGERVGFRTAVAPEVTVGNIQFRNVSFAVFPDSDEPWTDLAPGRRGALGIPVILGFRTLRWSQDGTLEIGAKASHADPLRSNLFFDDDHLLVRAALSNTPVLATLDTGAETTDLYEPFADKFPALIRAGAKGSADIHGVGNKVSIDSITIPQIGFELGGFGVTLHLAHVFMKNLAAKNCVGNFGIDLLMQARAFRIDFGAMRLDLESH